MKISVIMTSYNYAQYIEEAINSVINQTFKDWELIIVDDGSSDNSVEIIKSYCAKDERIKLFTHSGEKNKGLKESILLALEHATGDWVTFLESDDIWLPDYLSKKIEVVEKNSSAKIIFNKVEFFGEVENNPKKGIFKDTQNKLASMTFPRNMFKDFYLKNQILTFSCAMVKKETLLKINPNTPVDAFFDWWLWIHLAYKNDFYYIDEVLTKWRLHKTSYLKTSKKPKLPVLSLKAYLDVFKSTKDLAILPFVVVSQIKLYFCKAKELLAKKRKLVVTSSL